MAGDDGLTPPRGRQTIPLMTRRTRGPGGTSRRPVVIAGLRTPFVRSVGAFRDRSALDLGRAVVAEMVARTGLDPGLIDLVVYGQVVVDPQTPNIAREVVLGAGLPKTIEAYSVSRACASSTQALADACKAILLDEADVVVCGGADSVSRPPITLGPRLVDAMMTSRQARDLAGRVRPFLRLRPRDLAPAPPALKEPSTGLTMGESAEKMAKENRIPREDQDAFALRSHRRAAEAWDRGVFEDEVLPVFVHGKPVTRDDIVRPDTTMEKLARLKPVFDRRYGTITAGNSCALSDGASALLVASEEAARALGFKPLAAVRAWAFAAVDPGWQMLMGPSFAVPIALERAGMTLADITVVDIHEAFSAQVLSNLRAWASREWAREHLGRDEPIGEVPDDRLNVHGGSIALGHPFAATGARQVLTMANELRRRGGGTALVTQCAAGGLGAAVVLERDW